MASYIALNYWELGAASLFVFIDAGLPVIFRLNLHRSLLVAAIRMAVQLALVGLVLTTLFSFVSPLWTGIAAFAMVLFAGHEAAQRRVGHRLHDDVVGSGDGLRLDSHAAAEPLVRSTLCDTAARHDFGQLHDRHWPGSQYPDDEPRQPPRQRRSTADARRYQTGRRSSSNA